MVSCVCVCVCVKKPLFDPETQAKLDVCVVCDLQSLGCGDPFVSSRKKVSDHFVCFCVCVFVCVCVFEGFRSLLYVCVCMYV